jgi:signal transduction histidine kinase/CheY-like chemotaxis protein
VQQPIHERDQLNRVVGWLTVSLSLLGGLLLLFIRGGGSLIVALHAICAAVVLATFGISLGRGGFILSPLVPNLLIPLGMALVGERAGAKVWCGLIALMYSVLAIATHLGLLGLDPKSAFDYPQMMGYLFLATAMAFVYDSSRRELENEKEVLAREMRSRERLEALGQLAAGVSHDFNNLLTVFIASGESLSAGLAPGHPLGADARAILEAAARGSAITKRLLAFSRRDAPEMSVFDAGEMMTGLLALLQRSLPREVTLRLSPSPEGCWVGADLGKLEWVVMNLIVNARDAMPERGIVDLGVRVLRSGSDGERVVISVRDTGTGIDEEVLPHIFEPFFTTKRRGQGTGLGLATAYGDVRGMGGELRVESKAGRGALFEVVLERADPPPREEAARRPVIQEEASVPVPRESLTGRGTVLVVDDQPQVVRVARRVLSSAGFTVLEAHGGAAALDLVRANAGKIDVLLTDVVMPEMGGLELANAVRELEPKLSILFMSGYSDDPGVLREVEERRARFLPKPFGNRDVVREVSQSVTVSSPEHD